MKPGPYASPNLAALLPFKDAGNFSWKNDHVLELKLRYIETPHTETFICRKEGNGISVEIVSSKSNSKQFLLNSIKKT